MALTLSELELEAGSVLPARQTMRGGIGNGNLNTRSGDIVVFAGNNAQANVWCGVGNGNSASAAQSITVAPQTSGGLYVSFIIPS